MLGSLILYLKGMRIVMFQLSGFYYKPLGFRVSRFRLLSEQALSEELEACQASGDYGDTCKSR